VDAGGEEALVARHVRRGRVQRRLVLEHALQVHEENVGVLGQLAALRLARDDDIEPAVLVEVAGGEVDVRADVTDRGDAGAQRARLLGELHPGHASLRAGGARQGHQGGDQEEPHDVNMHDPISHGFCSVFCGHALPLHA
jgi:hypothetical protein